MFQPRRGGPVVTTARAFEFRVGGEWDFVMYGPDAADCEEWISWTEIAPPERTALLHGQSRGDPNAFESVLTFAPDGAATRRAVTVFTQPGVKKALAAIWNAEDESHAEAARPTVRRRLRHQVGPSRPPR